MADSAYKVNIARACTAVACAATATLLIAADTKRRAVVVKNNHASVVMYIGNSDVATATGFPLAAGESFTDADCTTALYGIMASGTGDARVYAVK